MKLLDENQQRLVENWVREASLSCENPECHSSAPASAGWAVGGIGPAHAVLWCTNPWCGKRIDLILSEEQAEALGFDRSLRPYPETP